MCSNNRYYLVLLFFLKKTTYSDRLSFVEIISFCGNLISNGPIDLEISYCVDIWRSACNIHLDPIVKIKKKSIRTIRYSSYLEHTHPLFDSLNILCFHKLVIQRISLIMFKNEVGLVPKPISQLFTKNNEYHDYNTRHSSSIHLSVGRGEAIYRPFSFHGINIWNYLKI